MAENFAELLHAAMKIDADGAVREAGASGDFGASHALDEAEDERLAIGFRKREDGVERGASLGAGVGSATVRRGWLVWFRGVGLFVECNVRLGAAVEVSGAVAGDGGEPASEVRRVAQGIEARKGLEENVLDQVVDVGMRHTGEKNTVDHASVAGVELAKGGAIAVLGGADEGVVGAGGIRRRAHGQET